MLIDAQAYHAHVYFEPADEAAATDLRDRAALELEARVWPVRNRPVGPHPLPMFEIEFALDQRAQVLAWLEANRGGRDVLVHPVTGDDLTDHSQHATWMGQPRPLDYTKL